jgi:hypothetical protein
MINSGIDPHQPIYRFLNFFDLFKLVKYSQLRLASLHQLNDINEGVGKVLRSIELSPAIPGDPIHLISAIMKHTTYVSCWTTVPDNIAMWILYSPVQSGMRIKTTVAKLNAVLERYEKEHSCNFKNTEDFQPRPINVFRMQYKDLRAAKKEIEENIIKTNTAMQEAMVGKSKADAIRASYKVLREYLKVSVLDNDAMKYKDKNYSHESEVRGQIQFDPITEEAYGLLMDSNFEAFANFIWLTVDKNFLEDICIDPRCPEYKEKIYKEIIDPKGKIKFAKSEAFGAVL